MSISICGKSWDFMGDLIWLGFFVEIHGIFWGIENNIYAGFKVSLPMSHCSMGWFGWENLNRKLAGFSPKICWEGPLEFPIMQLTCLSWVQLGQVNVQLNFWCLG